jgi:hypothetical protein
MLRRSLGFSLIAIAAGCSLTDNGGNDSTGADSTDDGGGIQAVSIYDIQQGMVPEGSAVLLRDVVVSSPVNATEGAVFVQEAEGGPWSGMYLFMYTEVVDSLDLAVGDVVEVRGQYSEYFEFSELTISNAADITKAGTTAPVVATPVDAAMLGGGGEYAESYESVLVTITSPSVSESDAGFGQFQVDGALLVDDWFLLEQGTSPHPPMGTVFDTITGPVLYEFEEFKLAPRTLEDFVGGTGLLPEPRTIPEIQMGSIDEGAQVILEDVVVTSPPTFEGDLFFVQDPAGGAYSGIAVYMYEPEGFDLVPGDRINITGSYAEYFDQSQIVVDSPMAFEKLGTTAMPMATTVAAADVTTDGPDQEAYEGVLVRVENATVTAPANMFGEWQIDDALAVDDLFFQGGWVEPPVDTVFASITGVMTYSFEEAKLAPTGQADLVAG